MTNHAAENILSIYERHADAFATRRARTLQEKSWLDKFAQRLKPSATILDIGCGNGQPIAEYFVQRGFTLTGVDGAAAMIGRARTSFPQQRWLHQDMRQLRLEETFDGLLAWDSFFHLNQQDQRAMFPIFAAHSHSGSLLMFTSGPDDGIAMGEFEGEPLFHASLSPGEYRALLSDNGFEVIEVVFEDPDCTGHSVWLSQRG